MANLFAWRKKRGKQDDDDLSDNDLVNVDLLSKFVAYMNILSREIIDDVVEEFRSLCKDTKRVYFWSFVVFDIGAIGNWLFKFFCMR